MALALLDCGAQPVWVQDTVTLADAPVHFLYMNADARPVANDRVTAKPATRQLPVFQFPEDALPACCSGLLLGRLCEPHEVASAALFLASDESSFVNGTHLFVDNAFSAV